MKGGRTIAARLAALMPALLLCAALAPARAAAQGFDAASAGTSSAQFLKVAAGARGAAMGEAYSALADDAFALDWNPAGLINVKNNSMVFMHSPYLADTFVDYVGYAETAGDVGAWGVSFKYMNFGKISRTDSSGMEIGSLTPFDSAINVGFACHVTGFNKDPEERFVLGATGKFVRSQIKGSDNTVSADMGLIFPYMFENRFRLSLAAQNIMGTLRYDKEEAPLPLMLRLGTVTRLTDSFLMTADVAAARDNLPYFAMGAELKVPFGASADMFLRGGFNTRAVSDIAGTRNITMGLGARYKAYWLDYAFSPFGDLGSVHRVSAALSF